MASTHPHGTVSRYTNNRCRCPACRRAWRDYTTARRRAQGVRPAADVGRFFVGRPGSRGFDPWTERVLDAVTAKTGRGWRDVIGIWSRRPGATRVSFGQAVRAAATRRSTRRD